jgi:hypothetical protein
LADIPSFDGGAESISEYNSKFASTSPDVHAHNNVNVGNGTYIKIYVG